MSVIEPARIVAARDVDDEEPDRHADLRRGQADAGRRVHRLDHVLRQRAQVARDVGDRAGRLVQRLVAVLDDRADHRGRGASVPPAAPCREKRSTSAWRALARLRAIASDRVAAERLEQRLGQDERDDGLADDGGGRHGAGVAAFDRAPAASCPVQRSTEGSGDISVAIGFR